MRKNQEVIDTQEKAVQDARQVHRYLITTSNVHLMNYCCATINNKWRGRPYGPTRKVIGSWR